MKLSTRGLLILDLEYTFNVELGRVNLGGRNLEYYLQLGKESERNHISQAK